MATLLATPKLTQIHCNRFGGGCCCCCSGSRCFPSLSAGHREIDGGIKGGSPDGPANQVRCKALSGPAGTMPGSREIWKSFKAKRVVRILQPVQEDS